LDDRDCGILANVQIEWQRPACGKVARRPRPPKEACVMSEMTELIVLLMSPIVAFTSFLFVDELRRSRNSSAD
jgi:hypothetical protein